MAISISGTLKTRCVCVCVRLIHTMLNFAFSMRKNESDVEQKKENCAQKSQIYTQRDAIISEVKSTVELWQMSVWKTETLQTWVYAR